MKKRKQKKRIQHEEGFTIIEIMVVVAIIGTLSAISTPVVKKHIKKGVEATLVADVREAAVQMEKDAVLSKNGSYNTVISEEYHNSENNNIVLLENDYSDYSAFCIIGRNETYDDLYVYYSSEDRIVTTAKNPMGDCGTGISYPIEEIPEEEIPEEELPVEEAPIETPPTTQPSATQEPGTPPTTSNPVPDVPVENNPVSPSTPPPSGAVSPATESASPKPPAKQPPAVQPPAPVAQPAAPAGYADAKRKKYTICHNGNALNLPLPGILNGHAGHGNDIIPPIPNAYPTGLNWTTKGAQTWYNKCVPK